MHFIYSLLVDYRHLPIHTSTSSVFCSILQTKKLWIGNSQVHSKEITEKWFLLSLIGFRCHEHLFDTTIWKSWVKENFQFDFYLFFLLQNWLRIQSWSHIAANHSAVLSFAVLRKCGPKSVFKDGKLFPLLLASTCLLN